MIARARRRRDRCGAGPSSLLLTAAGTAMLCAWTALPVVTGWAAGPATAQYVARSAAAAGASTVYRCVGARAMVPEHRCPHPYWRPAKLDLQAAAADGPNDPCQQGADATVPIYCSRGASTRPSLTIALVGNSHARRLLPGLAVYAQRHRWRIVTAMRSSCLGLVTRSIAPGAPTASCLLWSKRVKHALVARHVDAVVFAGYRFDRHFLISARPTARQLRVARAAILETWKSFRAAGIRVFVIEDVPGMRPDDDPACIARSQRRTDPCAMRRSRVVGSSLAATVAEANPSVATYVPLTQYFCDARLCHALIGGVVVYYDSHHMTTTFSKTLGPYVASAIAKSLSTEQPRQAKA
jgi:hypothetical protein